MLIANTYLFTVHFDFTRFLSFSFLSILFILMHDQVKIFKKQTHYMGNNSSLIFHPSERTTVDSLVYILSDFLGTYVNIHECDPNIPKKTLRPISAQQCIQNNPNWTPEA